MKFRFYVTDLDRGLIYGTNDASDAEDLAGSEDHFVVDTDTGEWVTFQVMSLWKRMRQAND